MGQSLGGQVIDAEDAVSEQEAEVAADVGDEAVVVVDDVLLLLLVAPAPVNYIQKLN